MKRTKVGIIAATALATGVVVLAGASLAADADESAAGTDTPAQGSPQAPHEHTDVTGAERTRVTDAVADHDADVTVEDVRKDPDGSYDVLGTKDGDRVMLKVSADLATITERTGGPGHGHGPQGGPGTHERHGGPGRGGHQHLGQDGTPSGDASTT